MPRKLSKKRPRVTTIGVSRLYNTGNYTNVKYDIAVEVPKGASATGVLRQLTHILMLLRPIARPSCADSYESALKTPAKDRSEYVKDQFSSWEEQMSQYRTLLNQRMAAVEQLDALGGTSTRKDAKATWCDEDVPW